MGKADVFTGMSLTEKLIWLKKFSNGGSAPTYEDRTAGGNPVIITPNFAQNAKALSVDFSPKKKSDGYDDLSGLSNISLTRICGGSSANLTIPLETNSCKGYVDVVNGTVTLTHQKFLLSTATDVSFSSITAFQDRGLVRGWAYVMFNDNCAQLNASTSVGYCDQLVSEIKPNASTSGASYKNTENIPLISNSSQYPWSTFFWMPYKTSDGVQEATVAGIKEWCRRKQVHLLLPLIEPIVYSVTPNQLSLLRGENTITTDGDSLNVTYQVKV